MTQLSSEIQTSAKPALVLLYLVASEACFIFIICGESARLGVGTQGEGIGYPPKFEQFESKTQSKLQFLD